MSAKETNPHENHRQRMRERVIRDGISSLQPHEVLEFILYYSIPRKNTNEEAHALLERFGSLSNIFDASPKQLQTVSGIGEQSAVLLSILPGLLAYYSNDRWGDRPALTNSQAAGAYCVSLFSNHNIESMVVVCLDTHKKALHSKTLFSGTINETYFSIRGIVEYALEYHANSIIIAHNHPSGSLKPSSDDLARTEEICAALAPLDIAVDDHIIVAGDSFLSLRRDQSFHVHPQTHMVYPKAAESPDPNVKKRQK